MKRCIEKSQGFTLVELLMVIAIMAALLAMALPGLQKARAAANVISCGSNLRQQSVAMQAYVHEQRDSALPWTERYSSGWAIRMTPYIGQPHAALKGDPDDNAHVESLFKNYSLFRCPENKLKTGPAFYHWNYGYNARLSAGVTSASDKATAWLDRRTMQQVKQTPSLIVMTTDLHLNNFLVMTDLTNNINYINGPRVHLERKMNFQFLDGHVELLEKNQRTDISHIDGPATGW